MSFFESKKTIIEGNKNVGNITVGDRNVITVSQKISEANETSITSDGEKWNEVVQQLNSLQKIIKDLPDDHEDVRDMQLIPATASAKKAANELQQNPNQNKQGFLDKFKTICEWVVKVGGLATAASPIIIAIANLIGIPIPSLPA